MSKKRRRFFINEKKSIALFSQGYGFRVKVMNFYQFRISHEEIRGLFFDWYHTQGSVVVNKNGINKRFGTYGDDEKLAIAMKKEFENVLLVV